MHRRQDDEYFAGYYRRTGGLPAPTAPAGVETTDSATVYLDLQASGVEVHGVQYTDAGTVYLDMQPLGGECYSRFHFTGEGEAETQWQCTSDLTQWETVSVVPRWSCFIDVQPGCV